MRYSELIAKMTLEEKAALLSGGDQFRSKAIERLNIPVMTYADGPHGLRKQMGSGDHLGLRESHPATCYPTASASANSWNEELLENLGIHLGKEATCFGVNMLLGPGLDIKRSPLCGRNFEYFSEDPYLSGKLAAAFIRGVQSEGISACPKHYAANNQEKLRQHSDSIVDERTLQEIYLTGFEIAVKEGKPLGIMSSYNRLNGNYTSECPKLLTDILVKEWGFDGVVVTDWGGSNDRVTAVNAGGHIEMPNTGGDSDREVIAAVRAGIIDEAQLDRVIDNILHVTFTTQLSDNPTSFDVNEHHEFARKVAKESIVLLKNDENILPLSTTTKVAVIGDFADVPRYQGFGSSVITPTKLERPLGALKEAGINITSYSKGYDRYGKQDATLAKEAIAAAKDSEIVLFFIGLSDMSDMEGLDRADMGINKNQEDLLLAIAEENPNIIAVFCGGSPFEAAWINKCKAAVHGYLGGQAGASAIASVVVGETNPSGKLAETWPIKYDDTPARKYYPGMEKTAEYRESIYVGYRYFDSVNMKVRFPFGYGLSYTNFEYTDLTVTTSEVSFKVKNTGNYDGKEVVQIYIGKSDSKIFRATKELKAFKKVFVPVGEEKLVKIPLDEFAFRYFNVISNKYEIEGGNYEIMVGSSSQDIRLTGSVDIVGTNAPDPYNAEDLPSYYNAKVTDVDDAEFEKLFGKPLPASKWDTNALLDINDTFSQLAYAKGFVGRLVHRILNRKKLQAEKNDKPSMDIIFIYSMPFRGIAKNTGGLVNMEMTKAILFIFNGHFCRGFGRLIAAFFRKRRDMKKTAKLLSSAGNESTKG